MPETPEASVFRVWMRSVDDWPLAKILNQISGGKPRRVTVGPLTGFDVTVRWYPPFEGRMLQSRGRGRHRPPNEFWGGPVFEELSGGNWMVGGRSVLSRGSVQVPGRAVEVLRGADTVPARIHNCFCPSSGGIRPGPRVPGITTVVTWLILPVVICLSQRLSHACLSISNYTVKLRMAH